MHYGEAFSRFGAGAVLALITLVVFSRARRRRPRSWWTFLWVVPFLLTVWSGWSTTSWGERYRYETQCREWWNHGDVTFEPASRAATATTFPAPANSAPVSPPSTPPQATPSRADFMDRCIDAQRLHADRRRADPDSSCDWEDSSGCPNSDYRGLWLGVSGIVGGAGVPDNPHPESRRQRT